MQYRGGGEEIFPQIFNVLKGCWAPPLDPTLSGSCTNSPSPQALVLFLSELRPEPGVTKTKIRTVQYVRCHRIR